MPAGLPALHLNLAGAALLVLAAAAVDAPHTAGWRAPGRRLRGGPALAASYRLVL